MIGSLDFKLMISFKILFEILILGAAVKKVDLIPIFIINQINDILFLVSTLYVKVGFMSCIDLINLDTKSLLL